MQELQQKMRARGNTGEIVYTYISEENRRPIVEHKHCQIISS